MENVETSRLLLLAVEVHEWETGVETPESFEDESNLQFNQQRIFYHNKNSTCLFTTSDKHNTLHLQMTLHKSPKGVQLPLQGYYSIVLLQIGGHHTFFSRFITADIKRLVQ